MTRLALIALLAAPPAFAQQPDPFLGTLEQLQPMIDSVLDQAQRLSLINALVGEAREIVSKGEVTGAERRRLSQLVTAISRLDPENSQLADIRARANGLRLPEMLRLAQRAAARSGDEDRQFFNLVDQMIAENPQNESLHESLLKELENTYDPGREFACERYTRLAVRPAELAEKLILVALKLQKTTPKCTALLQSLAGPPSGAISIVPGLGSAAPGDGRGAITIGEPRR